MAQASEKVPIHVALDGTLQMIRTDFTNLPNAKRIQLANVQEYTDELVNGRVQ